MRVPFPVRAMSAFAFRAWLTPPPLAPAAVERDLEALSGLSPSFFGGVATYEIGAGPVVVATHGWGGRAAQMAPVARRLADNGYRVVVPQLPGYAGGPPTDIKQVAAAMWAVIDDVGKPDAIVAHSFASMALRLALPDEGPDRIVYVAPVLDVRDALEVFGDRLGLYPWTRRGLRKRLEDWDRSLWPTFADIRPGQFPGTELLIVHDPSDGEAPFVRSAELAAVRPDTSVVAIDGAGHSRILSSPEALDDIVGFLTRLPARVQD